MNTSIDLTPMERLVLTAFATRDCHDGTSLASWLNGGLAGKEHARKAAEDVLKQMQRKGLLVTDRLGWFRLPGASD